MSGVSVQAPTHAAGQIRGGRDYQEDSFGVFTTSSLESSDGVKLVLILADGMGGYAGGKDASSLVVDTFEQSFRETKGPTVDRLRTCLELANDVVADAVDESPELSGMGTTLVAAVVSDDGLEWVSVGDSLLWLYRGGSLKRLNADHSMVPVFEHLVRIGDMSKEDAAKDRQRHALRSAICGDEIALIDASSQPVELQRDDIVVLASDGIDSLDSETLAQFLAKSQQNELDDSVSEILESVRSIGKVNQDNTTLILCAPCGLTAEESAYDEETTIPPPDHEQARSLWRMRSPLAIAAGLACIVVSMAFFVAFTDQASAQARAFFDAMLSIVVNR